MATAEVTKVTRKKMVEVEVQEDSYTLTLSKEEAKTLVMILGSVGGYPFNTARKYCDEISYSLRKVGVYCAYDPPKVKNGSITFLEGSLEVAEGR